MTKTVVVKPDSFHRRGDPLEFAGLSWLQSLADSLGKLSDFHDQDLVIESRGPRFAGLFEWVSFVSIADKILRHPYVRSVQIDFRDSGLTLFSPREFLARREALGDQAVNDPNLRYSERLLNLVGFLQSLGTRGVLRHPHSDFFYRGLSPEQQAFRSFHANSAFSTVIFGLTRIESREDSRRFLDEDRIRQWRENMGQKYSRSPLFQFDEIWRVLSHELAINTWEHSGATGFLAARVVRPMKDGEILPFVRMSYGEPIQRSLPAMGDFLEICVADSGKGILATLTGSYEAKTNVSQPRPSDVLAFAFDELGTRKSLQESWITERHALGRILNMVSKYGGALVLRSSGAEVTYLGGDRSGFTRLPNHLGFKPSGIRELSAKLEGTHLQILLPLEPAIQFSGDRPRSILVSALPDSYRVDHSQIRGHLIPLREALNLPANTEILDYTKRFRACCERLSRSIVRRLALLDPIIIDFHGLTFAPAEFETVLYYLQNVIQNRPVLLVQLQRGLASQIALLEEENAETRLNALSAGERAIETQDLDHSERRFFETYRTVNAPVLGVDVEGGLYLFGMPTVESRTILLNLIRDETPRTIAELAAESSDVIPALLAVLNNTSQLFEITGERWRCAWGTNELRRQAKRAMQHDFDAVVAASGAWRGREDPAEGKPETIHPQITQRMIGRDSGPKRFSLPWQNEWIWVKEFFECSRILSRGRYADEAAQVLIFRLECFLETSGQSLSDVKILASVTAPGLLLASAMHRWWPLESGHKRPSIVDLGYSMLRSTEAAPPPIAKDDRVVIVQDVLSAGIISGRVIRSLRNHGIEIAALLALVQLVEHSGTTVSEVSDWPRLHGVPHHALIRTANAHLSAAREAHTNDSVEEGDSSDFWVEPRTLRPFQYSMLRGASSDAQPAPTRGAPLNEFETESTCLVRAGHYVIGDRHHHIGIDILGTLQGETGTRIADWIADLCQGLPDRPQSPWESDRGFKEFKGDVTIVLMPLNSQIHYLWPKVEELLAQRGRRQPMWFLDATLFLGSGPVYRVPLQLAQLIDFTAYDFMQKKRAHKSKEFRPLRILILDDAIATGRTALTIHLALQRRILGALNYYGLKPNPSEPIVDWIRYFAVFNRMNFHNNALWHSMKTFGEALETRFVFEEHTPYIGFPPPDEKNCEQCDELRRVRMQRDQWRMRNPATASWLTAREKKLIPIMMDETSASYPVRLKTPIEVLPPRVSKKGGIPTLYQANYADAAISIFNTLMYQSYPPHDVLRSIPTLFQKKMGGQEEDERERYRWSVLEWSTRNWQRIIASGSRAAFFECARFELNCSSGLLGHLFYSLGSVLSDSSLAFEESDDPLEDFVTKSIDQLIELENERSSKRPSPNREERMIRLDMALNLFFLRLNEEATQAGSVAASTLLNRLLEDVTLKARDLERTGFSLAGELARRWSRPERSDASAWTLRIMADYLFRGQESKDEPAAADHVLLRGCLKKVMGHPSDLEYRTMLSACMGSFLKALDGVRPYMSGSIADFLAPANRVMEWLGRAHTKRQHAAPSRDIRDCLDTLNPDGELAIKFSEIFCPSLKEIHDHLTKRAASEKQLTFEVRVQRRFNNLRALVHRESLFSTLHNWTINPMRRYRDHPHKCRIDCGPADSTASKSRIRLRIVTDFESPASTAQNIMGGHGYDSTEITLRPFDVGISIGTDPTDDEKQEGYLAACELLVPVAGEWREKK
jgi:adenine/guanine phosphoribosyltransferase-like PRPP-binding protein